MSLADEIFAEQKAAGLKRKPLKAWGKDVWVWELTEADRSEFEAARVDFTRPKKPKINYRGARGRLIVLALRDGGGEDAKPIFQPADADRLLRLGGAEMDRVYTECAKLSGIVAGDEDDEGGEPKNGSTPAAASTSS